MSAMSIAMMTRPSWRRLCNWAGAALLTCSASANASAQTPPDQILLKDYFPRTIFRVPETRVEKARYPILDMYRVTFRLLETADEHFYPAYFHLPFNEA
jgi:hypothetical protein